MSEYRLLAEVVVMHLRNLVFTALGVGTLLLPGRAAAQSGTVTDDAFVSTNAATEAFNVKGQGISLIVAGPSAAVGSVSVGTTKSYIKFQLQSSLPPAVAAANVSKATLKLYLSPLTSPSGAIDIYPVTSAWSEATLSSSTMPTIAAAPFASDVIVGSANTFVVVDLTQLVQEWLEGPANGGIANDGIALVAHTSTSFAAFDSKENIITSHEPRLEIVLANSGPQGPAGPPGQPGANGQPGPAGPGGAAGQAATIAIGTVNPVAYNAAPAVMNTGTSSNAVLNFLIPQGQPGAIGPQGPGGATGPQGPVGINNRGQWSITNSYNINDAVSDQGSFWLAVQAITANTPNSEPSSTNASWQLLAAQGAQGPLGQTGSQGPQGGAGTQGPVGPQGPAGPAGPQGPQGPAGTGAGGGSSSLLSAFLAGPLTQAYTAAAFVPDSAITVTRISAALKAAPDTSCKPTVLRVSNATIGQDILLAAGQSAEDSGAMSLPMAAGSTLQVKVQTPASCAQTNPADANVLLEYRGQQSGDAQVCAQTGLACNGVCEETQSDQNNCGACGVVCPISQPCNAGSCGGGCSSGLTACGSTCVNLQTDAFNCGGCGNQCVALPNPNPPVPVCQSGKCINSFPSCAPGSGLTPCSDSCVNMTSDLNNCGACGNVCAPGQACMASQCVGTTPNGGVCNANAQCTSAFCNAGICSNCNIQHSNGAGQSYTDCTNALGTPGNPATYNLTMAQEAATAWANANGGGISSTSCNGAGAITAGGRGLIVGIWVYQGPLAGSVLISPVAACPTQLSTTTWN